MWEKKKLNSFEENDKVSIYIGGKLICHGTVSDADSSGIVIENSRLPIRFVGADTEVVSGNKEFHGNIFAFGEGCVDADNDVITRVCVSR